MTGTPVRFETLIERHHDEIYHYLWRLLDGSPHDRAVHAEDLTQDVFMRAYRAFRRLRADSNYRAWLYRIATNRAYTLLKRRGSAALDDEAEWLPDDRPEQQEQMILAESWSEIGEAISALPPRQRIALVMRYVQGLEYEEIAAALDCSQETARANVSHAIRQLRRELVEVEE